MSMIYIINIRVRVILNLRLEYFQAEIEKWGENGT